MSMGARGSEITGRIVGKVILSYMEQRPARYVSSKGPRTSATTSATHCSLVRADSPGGKVPLREFEDARKNLYTEVRSKNLTTHSQLETETTHGHYESAVMAF
jgi:hypothetical protein